MKASSCSDGNGSGQALDAVAVVVADHEADARHQRPAQASGPLDYVEAAGCIGKGLFLGMGQSSESMVQEFAKTVKHIWTKPAAPSAEAEPSDDISKFARDQGKGARGPQAHP